MKGTEEKIGSITVEGEQLAALIDIAAGEMKGIIEKLLLTGEKTIGRFTAEDIETVLQVLESINRKLAVQDISAEFLGFISECRYCWGDMLELQRRGAPLCEDLIGVL